MTSTLPLGIFLVALVLVIVLFAMYAKRSEHRRRSRADGSCPGDSGAYLFTGSDSGGGGCDGGSCGGGDGG
jgi:hypothetical protein